VSEPPAHAGVEHRWIEVDGVRLHVADTGGDGPPVLLVHGWPQNWWEWREVIPLLAPHHRVIAVDLRGFGWSDEPRDGYRKDAMAADVVVLLDALGIDRVDLVGHDWGGFVGFLLCLDHPERVRRFLVTNTGHPLPGRDPRVARDLWRFWYQFAIGAGLVTRGRLRRWMEALAPGWSDLDRALFIGWVGTPAGRRTSAGVYRTFVTREMAPILAGARAGQRLRQPTLWLHGEDDTVLRPALVESLRPHADDLTIEYVPGAGHFVVDERPELVAERALAFFAG
jgi:pimeloyl-ACP methyl ester carboxylesterase